MIRNTTIEISKKLQSGWNQKGKIWTKFDPYGILEISIILRFIYSAFETCLGTTPFAEGNLYFL